MNTEYRKLQKARNSLLFPEGVPLEFGCEVRCDEGVLLHQSHAINCEAKCGTANVYTLYLYDEHNDCIETVINDKYKILGKEVSMNDILRMLTEQGESISLFVKWNKATIQFTTACNGECASDIILDLTKSIPNQPQETLKQINELCKS